MEHVLTILIADDNPSDRILLKAILSQFGHKVITAIDGQDAIDKFDPDTIELVCLDIKMPHKDGYELIQEIRSDSSYDAIPLMVLTGRSSEKDKEEALNKGANILRVHDVKEAVECVKLQEQLEV